jgi:hypothetical protein
VAVAAPLDSPPPRPTALRRVAERVRPVTLARDQALPLLPAFAELLPHGLRRGATVAVGGGPGATSLALGLGVATSAAGSWVGVAGPVPVGLAAAGEMGVALERLVVVDPPAVQWSTVVAALLDAVDVVYARPPGRVTAGDARRLGARARERGSVLVRLPAPAVRTDPWPLPADHRLTVMASSWVGIGGGAGRLEARRVAVAAGGRGAASRERRAWLWLPDRDGGLRAGAPAEASRLPPAVAEAVS